jgi:argininosuccinate lyase
MSSVLLFEHFRLSPIFSEKEKTRIAKNAKKRVNVYPLPGSGAAAGVSADVSDESG